MAKIILSINAGSSSVKISVYSAESKQSLKQLAETQVDGLTSPPVKLKYSRGGKTVAKGEEVKEKIENQDDAFKFLLDKLLSDKELVEVSKKEDISFTCHRVVHGGDFEKSQVINQETFSRIEALTDLAPLHNAPALSIFKSCVKTLPKTKNFACFDSQFHFSMPEHIRTYPINQDIAKKKGLRRYGFHGISYTFITRSVAEFLGKKPSEVNIIALHLGSGASACAIKNGKSWDTSMGLTPVSGLPGATRSGNIDPSLVFHYTSQDVGKLSQSSTQDLHISKAEEILNKQSGWKSITGSTDFSSIASPNPPSPAHALAMDIFVDRICHFIGGYYVSLHGKVDALVFAGGIGEKSQELRRRVVADLECLGFGIDGEKNGKEIEEVVQEIGKEGAKHRTLVCMTDEQFEMARSCVEDEELVSFES